MGSHPKGTWTKGGAALTTQSATYNQARIPDLQSCQEAWPGKRRFQTRARAGQGEAGSAGETSVLAQRVFLACQTQMTHPSLSKVHQSVSPGLVMDGLPQSSQTGSFFRVRQPGGISPAVIEQRGNDLLSWASLLNRSQVAAGCQHGHCRPQTQLVPREEGSASLYLNCKRGGCF